MATGANQKLKQSADATNRALGDLQRAVNQLGKDQQRLFNAVNDAVDPAKKGPRAAITGGLTGVFKSLKDLERLTKSYGENAQRLAQEGLSEADKVQARRPASNRGNRGPVGPVVMGDNIGLPGHSIA